MNTIATTSEQPELKIAPSSERPQDVNNQDVKNFNLRALFAGSAASASLIAAGVIVFGSLAAYVAFNALPIGDGGGDAQADRIAVQVDATADAGAPARSRWQAFTGQSGHVASLHYDDLQARWASGETQAMAGEPPWQTLTLEPIAPATSDERRATSG